jgi:predicted metal-dependent phosphoesterase TrpH
MMKFDLHIHTRKHSPDAESDPFALVRRAKEIGLDGIVITEHDWLWTEEELDELREAVPSLVILAGVEVTGRGGDMLCYGVTDPYALPRGIEWGKLTREVHRQGGVCVAAHPYRWGQPFDQLLAEQKAELDGLEMMSKNMDADLRMKAARFATKHSELARLGNSDSHEIDTLGCCYTEFDAEIRTVDDLVDAIRSKKATPTVRK